MRIAIYGCGQLAMMLAQAAKKLKLTVSFIAEQHEDTRCVQGLGKIVRYTHDLSVARLFQLLERPHVITVEREQVDINLLSALAQFTEVAPHPDAIAVTQNRLLEKNLLKDFHIPLAPFEAIRHRSDLNQISQHFSPPFFIKHPTQGYDGKSQWRIDQAQQLADLNIDDAAFPLVVETKINFNFEASVIGVRGLDGDIRFYAPTVNEHVDGVLLKSQTLTQEYMSPLFMPAKHILSVLFHHWNYVGVLSLELFVTDAGLIVNELAPRVHNSGHWTMNACHTSQFENHIRAICGLSLGDTRAIKPAGMVNLLGIASAPRDIDANSFLYWYKKTPKARRKMGHINLFDDDPLQLEKRQNLLIDQLYPQYDNDRKSA